MTPERRLAVVGVGATGAVVAAEWLRDGSTVVEVADPDDRRCEALVVATADPDRPRLLVGERATAPVAVLACPNRVQPALARRLVAAGRSVVSTADAPDTVEALLALDDLAAAAGVCVVVGAGLSPGLSCLLARLAAREFDEIEEIEVAKTGTGGPACARQHHRALKEPGHEWLDGAWAERSGGTGRELLWFPGELGARDAYRAALPEPLLLQRVFPEASRLSARMTATRRDRSTSRLPMLRPPHSDGGPGGVRVEVRGRRAGRYETVVVGVHDHPSHATGVLAALIAASVAAGRVRPGARGVGEEPLATEWLRGALAAGVPIARFDGHVDVSP